MNILQINETAATGGAARCLLDLHRELNRLGHHAHALVAHGIPKDGQGITLLPSLGPLRKALYHGVNLAGLNYAGITGTRRIAQSPQFQQADVVHYHNLHGGYFNYLALPFLCSNKPSVLTLHDMWALTGHCAHSFSCTRWKSGCGSCPLPEIYPPIRRDATRLEWKLKNRALRNAQIHLVSPSAWLADIALTRFADALKVHHVRNGIDTSVFSPGDGTEARRRWNLPPDKFIVLFGAQRHDDPFKDYTLLRETLAQISGTTRAKNLLAVTFGTRAGVKEHDAVETVHLGYLESDADKVAAYRAANLLLYPTRADNQPLTVLESMACGTPVAGSEVGGMAELVESGRTGWLSPVSDATGLARNVLEAMSSPELRNSFGAEGRAFVLKHHTLNQHATAMLEVYRKATGVRT